MSLVAVTVAGAAEKDTSMLPADERKMARGDDTSWPRIDTA
jgi:hypothetical protein